MTINNFERVESIGELEAKLVFSFDNVPGAIAHDVFDESGDQPVSSSFIPGEYSRTMDMDKGTLTVEFHGEGLEPHRIITEETVLSGIVYVTQSVDASTS